jgi:cob(I)alamin adenosyltransferase
MAVHLTRIYTKTGDDGTTALGDMSRVAKTDARIEAFADVNEANAALGAALALGELDGELVTLLRQVQNDLFDLGADLCTPVVADPQWSPIRVKPDYTERLEQACDRWNADLPKLDSFILPGGTRGSALLQVALTVVRRAERRTWALLAAEPDRTNKEPVLYLNRLSDLLFILSRVANGGDDVLWVRGGSRTETGSAETGSAQTGSAQTGSA